MSTLQGDVTEWPARLLFKFLLFFSPDFLSGWLSDTIEMLAVDARFRIGFIPIDGQFTPGLRRQ